MLSNGGDGAYTSGCITVCEFRSLLERASKVTTLWRYTNMIMIIIIIFIFETDNAEVVWCIRNHR